MGTTLSNLSLTNNGYIRTKDFGRNRQLFIDLKVWMEAGKLEKIKPGLYRNVSFSQKQDWEEVSLIVPKGIFCLFSAWQLHGLTTHISSDFHLAIPHKAKITLPEYPPVKLYHWTQVFQETGIEKKEGFSVYDKEKSVCDAIRFRNKVGLDITGEVVKNYLKQKDRNLDKLLHYAGLLKVEKQLNQYLSVLI
jgi:predicted transcriptional regulator of viral defense system